MSTRRRNLFNGEEEVLPDGFWATEVNEDSVSRGDVVFKVGNSFIFLTDINVSGRGDFYDLGFVNNATPLGMCIFGATELYVWPIFVSFYQFKVLSTSATAVAYPINNYQSNTTNITKYLYSYFPSSWIKGGTTNAYGVFPSISELAVSGNYSLTVLNGGNLGCPIPSTWQSSYEYTDSCGNIHFYRHQNRVVPSLPSNCLTRTIAAWNAWWNYGHVLNIQDYLYQALASNTNYEEYSLINSPTILSGYAYKMWLPLHPKQTSSASITLSYQRLQAHEFLNGTYAWTPTLFELAAFSESFDLFDETVSKLQHVYTGLTTISSITSNYLSFVSCTPTGYTYNGSALYYRLCPRTGSLQSAIASTAFYTEALVPFFTTQQLVQKW